LVVILRAEGERMVPMSASGRVLPKDLVTRRNRARERRARPTQSSLAPVIVATHQRRHQRQRVRLGPGIEFRECFFEVRQPPRITYCAVHVTDLGLEPCARFRGGRSGERLLETLHRRMRGSARFMDIADRFIDRVQVNGAMQRLGGLARLNQEFEGLVVRKHPLGVGRCTARIRERLGKIARVHEVVGEVLRVLVRSRCCRSPSSRGAP